MTLKSCDLIFISHTSENHVSLSYTKIVIQRNRSYLPNLSTRAGYDTWSIFKRGLTGLN